MNWQPIETAPRGVFLRTKLFGEAGDNVSMRLNDGEWADKDGRTTVTHSTFLAPTHWAPLPEQPNAASPALVAALAEDE
jgi:hypothetical protein